MASNQVKTKYLSLRTQSTDSLCSKELIQASATHLGLQLNYFRIIVFLEHLVKYQFDFSLLFVQNLGTGE